MRIAKFLTPLLGYAFAAAALVWAFYDVELSQLFGETRYIDWSWVALALVVDMAGWVTQGLRWKILLRPVGKVSVIRATQGVFAGQFANQVLPVRLGELVRAFIASRWLTTEFNAIIPSVFLERLLDSVWSGVALGFVWMMVPLPKKIMHTGGILGAFIAAGTVFFFYTVIKRNRRGAPEAGGSRGKIRPVTRFLDKITSRIGDIGFSLVLFEALGLSVLYLTLKAVSFALLVKAYGLPISFFAGILVFFIVHLGTIIPNSPGNVGVFQFFTILGLILFGIDKTTATGFSIVIFVLWGVPHWVLGFLSMKYSGIKLRTVRKEIRVLQDTLFAGSR